MFLGYNTNGFAHHRWEDAVAILAESGYRGVAITVDHHLLNVFDADIQARAEQVRRALDRHGLTAVVETGARFLLDPRHKHQPTLISPTPALRNLRRDFLVRCCHLARNLGSTVVSFWSGSAVDSDPRSVLIDRLVDECRYLCDVAEECGVDLAFEPEPGMLIESLADSAELFSRVDHPRFGLTVDIGHLQCTGEIPISSFLEQWGPRIRNVHIEDMRTGVHDHLPFGQGMIDFDDVFAGLRRTPYQGGLYVELSRQSHDAVRTARQSFEFLCRYLAPTATSAG